MQYDWESPALYPYEADISLRGGEGSLLCKNLYLTWTSLSILINSLHKGCRILLPGVYIHSSLVYSVLCTLSTEIVHLVYLSKQPEVQSRNAPYLCIYIYIYNIHHAKLNIISVDNSMLLGQTDVGTVNDFLGVPLVWAGTSINRLFRTVQTFPAVA